MWIYDNYFIFFIFQHMDKPDQAKRSQWEPQIFMEMKWNNKEYFRESQSKYSLKLRIKKPKNLQ